MARPQRARSTWDGTTSLIGGGRLTITLRVVPAQTGLRDLNQVKDRLTKA